MIRGLAALVLMCALPCAHAHAPSLARVDIVLRPASAGARMEVDLALRDLALTLPIDENRDEQITWGELQRVRAPLARYVSSHLALASGRKACVLRPGSLATRRYDDDSYATLTLHARCPSQAQWRLHYDLLFEADPQHRAVVTVHDGDRTRTSLVHAGNRDVPLAPVSSDASRATGAVSFGAFLREGMHHILVGYDHLAFLLALLLPAALQRTFGSWQPVAGLRTSLLHVAAVVTAFTLAHSLTLALAALGWVRPAAQWVEPAIAASVVLAAANNVWPLLTSRLWALGFGFGLLHGFGFAGVLGDLGLPADARVLALVAFNLGVELGQLAVVLLVLPLLFAVRRHPWFRQVALPLGSLAIGVVALGWLGQRLA